MKKLRPFLLATCVLQFMALQSFAQQNLFYSHYFLNPFLYNPSFVAPDGYTELYLNYRNQWSGIEGAPTTGTVSIHLPINYKVGLALTGYQDKAGVLTTTTGLLTFGYQVHLGQRVSDVHKLAFGISAGMTSTAIDPDQVDNPNDPVIGTTSSFAGQFGMHYQLKNFKFAFAIPQIFQTYVASTESFNKPGIDQLKTTITSLSYTFKLGERFSFEPIASYRTYEVIDPQYEALGVFRIDNLGWLGGSYRQDYGASAFAGVNLKDKLKLGYAYEFATSQVDAFGDGTHEIQLVLRLGKTKHSKPVPAQQKTAPVVEQPVEEDQQKPEDEPVEEKIEEEKVAAAPPVIEKQTVQAPVTEKPAEEVPAQLPVEKQPVKKLNGEGLAPGHYVVVGAFSSVENAKSYANTLKRAGYPANVAHQPDKGYYIVHMINAPTLDEARQQRDKYRQMSRYSFRDTWILSIE